jgi:pimeloyl-ACP methyl ester carboxylesterase
MPPSVSESQSVYALEKTENFRWVANIFATPSPRILTSLDLAPLDLQLKLADIGQFAEVAHGSLSPEFIWKNMERLLQPYFPLEGYNALAGSELVSSFRGTVAGLQGYIARQSNTLVIAFSGTSNAAQSLRNIDARLIGYPGGGGRSVHAGFWKMYNGIRALALAGLGEALRQHEVHELILTGHSMGAAMCYLLALEALEGNLAENTPPILSSTSVTLTLAVFGSPRVGNLALAQHWRSVVADRIREYSVKAYNDGGICARSIQAKADPSWI